VLLCLDRSSSMAAEDLESGRSRLEVGRTLAAEFLAGRRDDRVGIVTFARFADLLCPPTVDHAAAVELLRRVRLVDPEGPEDATAIGAAVGLAASLLQRSRAAGKVVVVLTDGEENVATGQDPEQIAPLHAGQWCREQGVRVHAIVLGKGERMADGRWRALDTTAMRQLAKVSGGNFFAAADAAALRSVYREIDRLEAVQFGEPGVRVTEWYAVPAAAFLVLLFVGHLWSRSAWGGIP
ncbi:MAG TPA: VWA domain-containing protein, partial [bacterium]|nr:VWA domain-containing protein [bacterium]